jgi:hypothetical protein
MEIALIPPVSRLHTNLSSKTQMLIPAALKYHKYSVHYHYLSEWDGSYIIMDNGMFEHGMLSSDGLVDLALKYHAHEIVVPDAKGDRDKSINLAEDFMNAWPKDADMSFMFVPQGQSLEEVTECIDAYTSLIAHLSLPKAIIGLPRWMGEEFVPNARLLLLDYLADNAPEMKAHLLGVNRKMPADVREAAKIHRGYVRSMDTDAPFVWAWYGVELSETPSNAERPTEYFNADPDMYPIDLINKNIRTLREWANG